MSEGLPIAPPVLTFAEVRTGRTVGAGHTLTRASAANLVALARPAHRAITGPMGASPFRLSYTRSHASIKLLYVAVFTRMNPDLSIYSDTLAIDLTITDGLGNSVASSASTVPRGLRSGNPTTVPRPTTFVPLELFTQVTEGFLDLDALAVTLTDPSWSLAFAVTRTGTYLGVDRVELFEVPRTRVDEAEDYGSVVGPFNPNNVIYAGDESSPAIGYERLARTIEGAVACTRDYVHCTWPADIAVTTVPRTTSASFAPFSYLTDGTDPLPFQVFPEVVYTPSSAAGESARYRVLYYVAGGGNAVVRCQTGATGSPYDTATLTGASWQWSDWVACHLPTNGTGRIAEVSFKGKTSAGTLYLAGIHVQGNP